MRASFDPKAERATVELLLAGHPEAVDKFAERLSCVPSMLAIRNFRMGRPLTADELQDVVQDTFVVILRRLPDYEPLAPLESWIHGICALQLRGAVRAKHRRQGQTVPLEHDATDRRRSSVDLLGDISEVEKLLAAVGGIEAEIVRLKHLEGMSYVEMGQALNVIPSTVKTHYYRGMAALRDALRRRNEQEKTA